jgi:acyl-coenzyme A synthetase/AMP-(fatty) acid ligase
MSHIDFIIERVEAIGDAAILGFQNHIASGKELGERIRSSAAWLRDQGVRQGDAVALVGDFSIDTVSIMMALIDAAAISIPLTPATLRAIGNQLDEVQPSFVIDATKPTLTVERRSSGEPNELYRIIQERGAPGLVLFTSGSTGKPKAVVHDYSKLLTKFQKRRPTMVTLNFLLFDHWGGLNTLLHSLSNSAMLVLPDSRAPDDVCDLVERHRVELLPATPSFLNMLLISGAAKRHDLSSIKVISYGAEPMPASTLKMVRDAFPKVELRQTYGMIELGVLRAKSKDDSSLWVKLGGEGYDLRVVDGVLQVRAAAAMLGYLNAPSPITPDGYFITGDMVEQDGEYFKILGRQSDLINVGGQKVYPAEVETVLLQIEGVVDASVFGERHPLLGKIVCAAVVVAEGQDEDELRKRIKRESADRLQPFMVPIRIIISRGSLQNHRLKRQR